MISRPVRIVNISSTYLSLRLSQRRLDGREISGRNVKAASSWLLDASAMLTACSTSSKVPGKREAKRKEQLRRVFGATLKDEEFIFIKIKPQDAPALRVDFKNEQ